MTSTDADQLAAIRATADYQDFLAECLEGESERVLAAQQAVVAAENRRKIQAALAVRGGFGKTSTAAALGISRPTLDAWLSTVERDADLLEQVTHHERWLVHNEKRKAQSGTSSPESVVR